MLPTSAGLGAASAREIETRDPSAARGVAVLLTQRLLLLILAGVFAVVVPRRLGPVEWDYFVRWFFLSSAIMAVLGTPTDAVARRYVPALLEHDPSRVGALFGEMAVFKGAIALVLALCFWALSSAGLTIGRLEFSPPRVLACAFAGALAVSFSSFFASMCYGFRRMAWFGTQQILVSGVRLVLVLALFEAFGRRGLDATLALYAVPAMVVLGVVVAGLLPRRRPASPRLLKRFLVYGFLVHGGYLFLTLMSRMAVPMIGESAGARAGFAGIGMLVAKMVFVIGNVVVEVAMPSLVVRRERGDAAGRDALARGAWRTTMALIVPMLVGGVVLAGPLSVELLGKAYAPGTAFLVALLPLGVVEVLIDYFQKLSLVRERHRAFFTVHAAGLAVFFATTPLLIQEMGAWGAVWGMWAGHAVLLAGAIIVERRETRRAGFWSATLRPLVAGLLMALAMTRIPPHGIWFSLASGAAGMAVYIVALAALGGLPREDIAGFIAALRERRNPDPGTEADNE